MRHGQIKINMVLLLWISNKFYSKRFLSSVFEVVRFQVLFSAVEKVQEFILDIHHVWSIWDMNNSWQIVQRWAGVSTIPSALFDSGIDNGRSGRYSPCMINLSERWRLIGKVITQNPLANMPIMFEETRVQEFILDIHQAWSICEMNTSWQSYHTESIGKYANYEYRIAISVFVQNLRGEGLSTITFGQ